MADSGLIDGGYAFITRGTETFKVSARGILVEVRTFMCRKCNHNWLPKDRDFTTIPLHCPKCYDKYWFLSHEEIKKVRRGADSSFHSNKEEWEKPISKLAVKHEPKEDWD